MNLPGKILYEEVRIMNNLLGISCSSPGGEYEDLAKHLNQNDSFCETAQELRQIVDCAEEDYCSRDFGECKDEIADRRMGETLYWLFKDIGRLSSTSPERSFVSHSQKNLWHTPSASILHATSPDIVLLDKYTFDYEGLEDPAKYHVAWKDVVAFVQAQALGSFEPVHDSPLSDIVAKAIEHARLHLSTRPLQVFSLALLICGNVFCVAYFDRANAILSPKYHIWDENTAVNPAFIAVVMKMSTHLGPQALGIDPTSTVIQVPRKLSEYPITQLQVFEVEGRESSYITSAEGPFWSSTSLFGSGASVWPVLPQSSPNNTIILKNVWRKEGDDNGNDIHQHLATLGNHPSIARFVKRADVRVESEGLVAPMDICRIRETFGLPPATENLILHRLELEALGLPLWLFGSAEEFACCLKDLISGFRFLEKSGIVHRNINPGNLFLVRDSAIHSRGIITGFESAAYTATELVSRGSSNILSIGSPPFMANQLLRKDETSELPFQPRHDQESLLWVGIYTLYVYVLQRNLTQVCIRPNDIERNPLFEEFIENFNQDNIRELRRQRRLFMFPFGCSLSRNSAIRNLAVTLQRSTEVDKRLARLLAAFVGPICRQHDIDYYHMYPPDKDESARTPSLEPSKDINDRMKGVDLDQVLMFIDLSA